MGRQFRVALLLVALTGFSPGPSLAATMFYYCMWLNQGTCRMSCGLGEVQHTAPFLCAGSNTGDKCCARATTTAAPSSCGRLGANVRPKIVGGREAARCEFPWMVYINLLNNYPGVRCGGSVIDDRHIITAAHCFSNSQNGPTDITIGEFALNETTPEGEVTTRDYRIIVHPAFDAYHFFNDIAILKLTTPINFSHFTCVQPICLPPRDQEFAANTQCLVAGWGILDPGDNVLVNSNPSLLPSVLRTAALPIVSETLCDERFREYFNSSIEICAGDLSGTRDTCNGDSGGPLMCPGGATQQYYLVGVTSVGSDRCAKPNVPAIYTRVTAYLPWIYDVIAGRR